MQPISHEQDPALLVPPEDRDDDKPNGTASLYEWVEAAVFSLIVVVLVFTFLFRIVGVDGRSMQTTLMDKDRLILSALPYTPERGDIVVINRYTKEPLVKRIIAVENDTISIDEESHRVILNGEILNEPYIQVPTYPEGLNGTVQVPQGKVFVMGDNRTASLDSRDLGFIDVHDIMGKAVFRIFPFDRFGGLYPES